ncbi:sugar transferase [Bradyrhizobium sp. CCBAU 53415]|uniref:sugar transferase n=1 Tax=Bradyrhizobium sp. CCBAU 53415 TaxID=1325119 RepID=UPI003FA4D49E
MSKRLFDLTATLVGLSVLAIPLLVLAAIIKFYSPGPLFFRQVRAGRYGRPFQILKFRTMTPQPDAVRELTIGEDPRITSIGRILRKSKLDELPQLINVLRGDMSLVGPRPEVPEFVQKYSPADFRTVLSVRPGLTDFASIRFRNESELLAKQSDPVTYYENVIVPAKLRYSRFYVRRASVRLDLYIIISTIITIGRDFASR